jgi:hypothetical protein
MAVLLAQIANQSLTGFTFFVIFAGKFAQISL